ncbi:hypothetical protein BOTBODRAFT_60483 [Botryobasidium botryosum FD-172 SS1]|uniref:F-box domain-containing protein n=1 Tax=Botryobasidium botryosum (strain FD-172 SS1) TaxID=930990 RepID=A0A067M492_BOTB1|nr:hypothetical protein BOTBODRAFT_60483 [Botryobasidium botryosum FD-172 SS1]
MPLAGLPVDILPVIFEHLGDPGVDVFRACALVNKVFNSEVRPFLWYTVTNRFGQAGTPLSLEERPELARYVRAAFEVARVDDDAYARWLKCISMCTRLESYTIRHKRGWACPTVISILRSTPTLRTLAINQSPWMPWNAGNDSFIVGLRHINLHVSQFTVLYFSTWAEKLAGTLEECELHLDEPGPWIHPLVPALKSLINVRRLSITWESLVFGADGGILGLVSCFVHLDHLAVQYGYPAAQRDTLVKYRMPSVKHLTVHYWSFLPSKPGYKPLYDFVLTLASSSPHLESVTITIWWSIKPAASAHRFLESLAAAHGASIKRLCIPCLCLKSRTWRQMDSWFPHLEELSVAVGPTALASSLEFLLRAPRRIVSYDACKRRMMESIYRMKRLSKLSLRVLNCSGTVPYFSLEEAAALLLQGPPRLRHVCANDDHWVAKWMYDEEAHAAYFGVDRERMPSCTMRRRPRHGESAIT